MKIGIDKLFPCVLIFLDVLAAAVYGGTGDIKKRYILDCRSGAKYNSNILIKKMYHSGNRPQNDTKLL